MSTNKVSANSNCLVSHVILYPDTEIVSFNGLAWSNIMGVIHQSETSVENNPEQWLGTQN